jgi:hypothetical protein
MPLAKTQVKTQRIELGLDELAYTYAKRLDTALFQDVDVLNHLIKTSIGKDVVDDYNALLADPIGYLSKKYWERFGDKFPSNSNRVETFIRQSGHSKSKFIGLVESIADNTSKLRNNHPIIEGGTIASGLVKDNFKIVVHKDKTDLYKLILKVLSTHKAINKMQKTPMDFHILRGYMPMLELRGSMLRPSKTFFSKS